MWQKIPTDTKFLHTRVGQEAVVRDKNGKFHHVVLMGDDDGVFYWRAVVVRENTLRLEEVTSFLMLDESLVLDNTGTLVEMNVSPLQLAQIRQQAQAPMDFSPSIRRQGCVGQLYCQACRIKYTGTCLCGLTFCEKCKAVLEDRCDPQIVYAVVVK